MLGLMRALLKSPLVLGLAAALACVVSGDVRTVEHVYWNFWYKFLSVPAPQSAVVVALDDGTAADVSSAATSTAKQAVLVRKLTELNAGKIYLDYPAAAGPDPTGDAALRSAIAEAGERIVMVNRARLPRMPGIGKLAPPKFVAPPSTVTAVSTWEVNLPGYALRAPPAVEVGGRWLPSVAVLASGRGADHWLYPDFRIDPDAVPVLAAKAILTGKSDANEIADRQVYVSSTSPGLETNAGYFGHGRVASALIDISTANRLAQGPITDIPGQPLIIFVLGLILLRQILGSGRSRLATYSTLVAGLLVLPVALLELRLTTGVGGALILVGIYAPLRLWQKWRHRLENTSSASGLPNLDALASIGIPQGCDVVAVSVSHYEHMLSSLPSELHGECARQIARRLSIAAGGAEIYDSGNGHFLWLARPYSIDELVAQLEGLKALFSAPLSIDGNVLDTNVHFGLDRNGESKPINRIKSAIFSSSEAQSKGKLYEEFGRQRLAETPWELSLHARIDEALSNGDIWLAYQAQFDLTANQVNGAETLIRWNDPNRGVIPPDSFILQAERAGRIDSITYWVLEHAISASNILYDTVGRLQLSVNLSAWMVDQPGLLPGVSEISRRHGLDCSRITFEVTETFSLTNRDLAKQNLAGLRAMGFKLSIDDFGTGQAGLAYLSEIPSDEIKLDRRFIQNIVSSDRDRAIVSNTVLLAHALNQQIVAEGVEDRETLELLRRLGCDVAQGYYIGRPISFQQFQASLIPNAKVANFS